MNEMTHAHTYRRLFASDLLKVDKDTKNVNLNNNEANVLNQIEEIVPEPKPKVIKEKRTKPVKEITDEPEEPKEIRRSARGQIPNKQSRDIGFVEKKKVERKIKK